MSLVFQDITKILDMKITILFQYLEAFPLGLK